MTERDRREEKIRDGTIRQKGERKREREKGKIKQ
jgi:hypothetical protein